jgi:2-polyprenyl-3-methyl-5-hydroxy-6-metoxy-1,4-benzoquinol methylase
MMADSTVECLRTKLLAIRLRELWEDARENYNQSPQQCAASQELELKEYAAVWARALLLPGEQELVHSVLVEIARQHGIHDLALVRRQCETAVHENKLDWEQRVRTLDSGEVEKYYDSAHHYIDELMWWHTLAEDNSPLAYVAALEFALVAGCRTYLDFGSGVGSGALLFQSHGFDVSLADISSSMLSFCRYRFAQRDRGATFINLQESNLPEAAFDFITAMDVFEHLVEPAAAVDTLHRCLKSGGYIYGRFASEIDRERPQHIVHDFGPVFERFAELGFKEVYRDDWLWGHQVFQKAI